MTNKTLSIITATLLLTTHTFAEETLQDITVVSATKATQSLQSVTSNTSVITAQEIEERGYTTVAQALNSIAGIAITQNGGLGQSTSVRLRGMDSKRTLVLIDGVRYNDLTGVSGAPFEHIMVDNIAQIEVIKGAQSGVWGADASAGVINIITKKSAKGFHAAVHVEGGSFNTKKYGATLSNKTDRYYLNISHNVVDTDGFSALAPQGTDIDTFEDDGYTNKTTSIKLGLNMNETNKIEFAHTRIDAEGEYDTYANPNGVATSTTKDQFSSVKFHHVDSFNEINLYAKRSKFDRTYTAPDYTGVVKTTPYEGNIDAYGMTSKIAYNTNDFVLIGAEYHKFEQEDSINKDFNNKGFFINNTNTFKGFMGGQTILTESLRTDTYSEFDNKTTGKIGLKHIHGAIEGLTTSVNYGTAYNVPTLYQLYSPYGSATLTPESTTSWDVTLNYKDFTLSYFHTAIDDIIDFDMRTYTYNNIAGTSEISGIEASYKKEVLTDLLLCVNYTHLINAQDQKGNDLIRRDKDDVKVAVDYYGITNLHVGVEAQYVGSRTDTVFNADFTTSAVETGKYTVVNMTVNYDFNKEISLYGKIDNLTDKTYQSVYGYTASPRAFYAGVRAKF
jgi:vitamin B12 transporter